MDTKKWILRWWPLLYSVIWFLWAIVAPEPWLGGRESVAHVFAFMGAVGLLLMGLKPEFVWVRILGTMSAVLYPLHRAFSIVADSDSMLSTERKIIASTFSLCVVLSLLIMYPSLWWYSKFKDHADEG